MTEKLVLAVDGGGTKTRAVIRSGDGKYEWSGVSTTSNVSTVGVQGMLKAVRSAVNQALDQINDEGSTIKSFDSVWVGLAGIGDGASALHALSLKELKQMFDTRVDLSTDGDLVKSALTAHDIDGYSVILITGTGSVALLYDNQMPVGRVGGYGHFLGDEGSGFWIGKRALQEILRVNSKLPISQRFGKPVPSVDPWQAAVLSELGLSQLDSQWASTLHLDFIEALSVSNQDHSFKVRVAKLAKIVHDGAYIEGSKSAKKIMAAAADELSSMVASLVLDGDDPYFDSSKSTLVLSGSLFGSEGFRNEVKNALIAKNVEFQRYIVAADAASSAAAALLK